MKLYWLITVITFCSLCGCGDSSEVVTRDSGPGTDSDSITSAPGLDTARKDFPPPMDIQKILESDRVYWTNSVEPLSDVKKYWHPDTAGFFGSYNLLTLGNQAKPIGYTITYITGSPHDWKLGQITEWFVHAELFSGELSVWDSISVGTPRTDLLTFLSKNKVEQAGDSLKTELEPYNVVFIVKSDTVNTIIIDRFNR